MGDFMSGPAQPESRAEKGRFLWGIAIIIGILLIAYIFLTSGYQGVSDLLKKLITYALIVAVVGLIIWGVLRLFQKPKVDLVANIVSDIVDAGVLSKPPMVKDIYFTGDKEHSEFRLGTIIGYCQVQSYKDTDLIANLTEEQVRELERQGKLPSNLLINEDCFVFKRWAFPLSLFEKPKVLRVFEHEHSQIVGDVKVYAVSVIKKYDQYWPNRAHLDQVRIDISVIREAWRGLIHQYLKDSVAINQRAVGLDSEYKKDLDMRKLLKLPQLGGASTEEERYRRQQ